MSRTKKQHKAKNHEIEEKKRTNNEDFVIVVEKI